MFQTIVMTRAYGFAVSTQMLYESALKIAEDAVKADKETTAVIYGPDMQLLWRWFGNIQVAAPPVVKPEPKQWQVRHKNTGNITHSFDQYTAAHETAVDLACISAVPYDILDDGAYFTTIHPPE